jgi:hypothetical protein
MSFRALRWPATNLVICVETSPMLAMSAEQAAEMVGGFMALRWVPETIASNHEKDETVLIGTQLPSSDSARVVNGTSCYNSKLTLPQIASTGIEAVGN